MKKILKIKVWNEFGQFNAQVPILFIVGVGDTEEASVENLIYSLRNYVSDEFRYKIVYANDTFSLEIENYSDLLIRTIEVQSKAYNFTFQVYDKLTLEEYFELMRSKISNFDALVEESI